MVLVGPRPIVALEATHYGDTLNVLLSVRPGLTGRWAVEGRSWVIWPGLTWNSVRSKSHSAQGLFDSGADAVGCADAARSRLRPRRVAAR